MNDMTVFDAKSEPNPAKLQPALVANSGIDSLGEN